MNIGCILWCLLCLLVIALVACITPWWFIPLIVVSTLLYMAFDGGSLFKSHKSHKAKKRKHHHNNDNDKTKVNKSNVVGDTAAVLAGAALYHNIKKHHKHDETKANANVEELDLWDAEHEDLYDMGIEESMYDNDDDLAAYDDYIASLDDDN